MRLTHSLLVFSCCTLAFLSCSKNKDNDTPLLNKNKVSLWAGQDSVITLNAQPAANGISAVYTAVSANEEVAHVMVQGSTLVIHTSIPGKTTIEVKGPDNKSETLDIETISVLGTWRRVATAAGGKASVDIQCSDSATAATLSTQLLDAGLSPRELAGYHFRNNPGPEFLVLLADRTTRQGAFSFRDLTLTLTEGNTIEIFRLHPQGLRKFALEQDLTTHFQSLYPGKGITRVIQIRYFYDAMSPG